ncbi:ABC transporter substrate-binding protein [Nesterenkonia salmonea]|nr:ABC transporter substrate-binding protein [Nesterenkonia salmonea]
MSTTTHTTGSKKLAAAVAVAALAVTACGNEASADDADGDFGDLEVPLSWIKTAEFAGNYFAEDNGYYEEAGFESVNLISGGPSATPSATQLATGTGLAALSNPVDTGSFIEAEGDDVDIKIIGSVFQTNAFSIFSLADNPASEPDDLTEMTVGVAPNNEGVFYAFLDANDLDPDDVEVVTAGGDASGLITGEYDAYIGYATNQAISVELDGHDLEHMMLHENGLPFAAGSIITTQETIDSDRETLKAFLEATIRGWHDALEDDDEAARITVEDHGADQGLDMEHQVVTAERQAELIADEWTAEHGLLTMSDEAITDSIESVRLVGYDVPDDLFDLSLVEEVYEENPDLMEHP